MQPLALAYRPIHPTLRNHHEQSHRPAFVADPLTYRIKTVNKNEPCQNRFTSEIQDQSTDRVILRAYMRTDMVRVKIDGEETLSPNFFDLELYHLSEIVGKTEIYAVVRE